MDLLPRDVWEDFNSAQQNLQNEIECVVRENQRLQFNWGQPHRDNIFSKAKEIHEQKMIIQNKVFHQKMQLKHQQQQQQNAPNPKTFGNGLQRGFLQQNQQNQSTQQTQKLTKKEKQELKRQKKHYKNQQQPNMLQTNIENPSESNQSSTNQQPRRRKLKRKFSGK